MITLSKKQLLKAKYQCAKCGKMVYAFNCSEDNDVCHRMIRDGICWECAYWERFLIAPPKNLEIVGDRCYQIFPFVESPSVEQILGGNKIRYLLKKNGECVKTNDWWWLNVIPYKYQERFQPTGWWVTKGFYKKMERSKHKCKAKGCLDRYHCYRYQYRLEFDKEPYNKPPRDWIVGDEHCPAFLPTRDIKDFDEYVKPSDIIDESSVDLKL